MALFTRMLSLMLALGMALGMCAPTRTALADTGAEEAASGTQEDKRTVPTPSKHVRNASTTNGAWASHVCAGVGDVVNYRLEASLPTDLASYKGYSLWFDDKIGDGLAYVQDSVRSYVRHSDSSTTSIDLSATFSDKGMRVGSNNILGLVPGLRPTNVIVVEYDCVVLANATTGLAEGNPNEVTLQYTTDHDFTATGKSVTQTTSVHALGIEIRKVAQSGGARLAGARFVLKNAKGEYLTGSGAWTSQPSEAKAVTTNDQGVAEFTGIGEGTFTLTETKAPDGYDALQGPVTVTLTASNMDSSRRTFSAKLEGSGVRLVSVDAAKGKAVVQVQDPKAQTATTSNSSTARTTSTTAGGTSSATKAISSVLPTTADKLFALGGCVLAASVAAIMAGLAKRRPRGDAR